MILLAILRLGSSAYGVTITEELARRFFELEEPALEILRESRNTFMSLWDGLGSELGTP